MKFVFIHAPGGFEEYFRAAARAFEPEAGERRPARELAAEYGSQHVGPPLGGI